MQSFDISKLAERLKDARKKSGMTQKDLAKKIGSTQARVSFFEGGQAEPSISEITKICETLEISLSYLVGEKKEPEPTIDMPIPLSVWQELQRKNEALASQAVIRTKADESGKEE